MKIKYCSLALTIFKETHGQREGVSIYEKETRKGCRMISSKSSFMYLILVRFKGCRSDILTRKNILS